MNGLAQTTFPTPSHEISGGCHVVTLTVDNNYADMKLVAEFANAAFQASGPTHGQPVKEFTMNAKDGETELVAVFRNLHCAHDMYKKCEEIMQKMPAEIAKKLTAQSRAVSVA